LVVALRLKKEGPTTTKDLDWPTTFREHVLTFIQFAHIELLPHFEIEESVLFNTLQERSEAFKLLIQSLQNQHTVIRESVKSIERSFSATALTAPNPQLQEELKSLGVLLEQHIRKEERELFPMMELELPTSELEQIGANIAKAHHS